MQVRGFRHLVLGIVLCLSVIGCSHHAKRGGNHPGEGPAMTQGAGEGGAGFAGATEEQADLLARRKIYFDYDRSDLHEQDYGTIAAHADYLKHNRRSRLRVEGHTDEHGSREYNVALGERRARTVAQALVSQGAAPNQIITVSFGKEKPDAAGYSEEAHRLNRRAVMVYEEM